MATRLTIQLLVLLCISCSDGSERPSPSVAPEDACRRLATELGLGDWKPDLTAEGCRDAYERITSWLEETETLEQFTDRVLLQSNQITNALMKAVSDGRIEQGFSRYPKVVPCVAGARLQAEWSESVLGKAGLGVPERLYYSFGVEFLSRVDDRLRVRYTAYQNLDCDKAVGETTLEGWQVIGGNPFLPSGWTTIRNTRVGNVAE